MIAHLRKCRILSAFLSVLVFSLSVQTSAHATMISTSDLITDKQITIEKATLLASLGREDVRQALASQGVDPTLAKQRVAGMTDEEVHALNQNLGELPAGSGIVGAIVLVFLVLLFTDIQGYTDVFPFVKKKAK